MERTPSPPSEVLVTTPVGTLSLVAVQTALSPKATVKLIDPVPVTGVWGTPALLVTVQLR
jgi:hypothetical protein